MFFVPHLVQNTDKFYFLYRLQNLVYVQGWLRKAKLSAISVDAIFQDAFIYTAIVNVDIEVWTVRKF